MSCDDAFALWLTHYPYRKHPDNSELVENAATLLMELANYRKSKAMYYISALYEKPFLVLLI